jgi:hypothetical protein
MLAEAVEKGCGVASYPFLWQYQVLEFSWSMRGGFEKVELLTENLCLNLDNHSLAGSCYPWLYIDFLKEGLHKTGQINRSILPH